MPGAAFKRAAQRARETIRKAHYIPYSVAREAIVRIHLIVEGALTTFGQSHGDAPPSFVSNLVEKMEKVGRIEEEENRIRYAAGVVYGGKLCNTPDTVSGSGTTLLGATDTVRPDTSTSSRVTSSLYRQKRPLCRSCWQWYFIPRYSRRHKTRSTELLATHGSPHTKTGLICRTSTAS